MLKCSNCLGVCAAFVQFFACVKDLFNSLNIICDAAFALVVIVGAVVKCVAIVAVFTSKPIQ